MIAVGGPTGIENIKFYCGRTKQGDQHVIGLQADFISLPGKDNSSLARAIIFPIASAPGTKVLIDTARSYNSFIDEAICKFNNVSNNNSYNLVHDFFHTESLHSLGETINNAWPDVNLHDTNDPSFNPIMSTMMHYGNDFTYLVFKVKYTTFKTIVPIVIKYTPFDYKTKFIKDVKEDCVYLPLAGNIVDDIYYDGLIRTNKDSYYSIDLVKAKNDNRIPFLYKTIQYDTVIPTQDISNIVYHEKIEISGRPKDLIVDSHYRNKFVESHLIG